MRLCIKTIELDIYLYHVSHVWSHAEVELKDGQLDTTGDNRKKDIQEP